MSQSDLKLQALLDAIAHAIQSSKATGPKKRQSRQAFKATHAKLSALTRAQPKLASLQALQNGMQRTLDSFKRLHTLQNQLAATAGQTNRLSVSERRLRSEVIATNAALSNQKTQLALLARQEERLAVSRLRTQRIKNRARRSSSSNGLNAINQLNRGLDTINILNALVKQEASPQWQQLMQAGGVATQKMRGNAIYSQLALPLQKLGPKVLGDGLNSIYKNLYQGQASAKSVKELQNLGLIDSSQLIHGKLGEIKGFNPGAIKNAALLKESPFDWLEQVLLPLLTQKGMTQPEQIKNTIAKIVDQPEASNVLTTLYTQRAQIHQNANVKANAANAENPDARYQGLAKAAQAKEAILSSKVDLLKSGLRQKALPLYNQGLDLAIAVTDRLNQWVEQHPKAAEILVDAVLVTGTALIAVGKLSAVLDVLSLLDIRMSRANKAIGLARKAFLWLGRGLSTVFGVIRSGWRILAGLATRTSAIGTIVRAVGVALSWLGALILEFPLIIGGIIAAIVGAIYVWRNWDTLGPRFAKLWQKIKENTINTWNKIEESVLNIWDKTKAGAINKWQQLKEQIKQKGLQFLETLTQFKDRCVGIGVSWIQGIGTGIAKGFNSVKQILTYTVNTAMDWVKDALNWETLAPKLAALWEMIKEGAANKWEEIKEHIKGQWLQLIETLTQFKDQCLAIGADWIRSLGDGILEGFNSIKQIFLNSVDTAMNWVKEALHLPETSSSPALAFAGANMPMIEKNPNPVNLREMRPAAPVNGDTINITIQGTPGMDATAIAQAVRAELEKRERDKAARLASRFSD